MSEEMKDQEVSTEPVEETPKTNDLNITDLVAVKSIIDVASQRGAFKAGELEAVGKVYNKLSSFIDSVAKKES